MASHQGCHSNRKVVIAAAKFRWILKRTVCQTLADQPTAPLSVRRRTAAGFSPLSHTQNRCNFRSFSGTFFLPPPFRTWSNVSSKLGLKICGGTAFTVGRFKLIRFKTKMGVSSDVRQTSKMF